MSRASSQPVERRDSVRSVSELSDNGSQVTPNISSSLCKIVHRSVVSLRRPKIFEKVVKIGVGVHIWLLQVSKLTHN